MTENTRTTRRESKAARVEEDTMPVAPDRSGWTPHPSERRDFWNRIRAFPPEVARWRKRFLREIAARPTRFMQAAKLTPEHLQERLDDDISFLRELARILAVLYGSPDLGNKPDPTDEMVYIILARKTREAVRKRGPSGNGDGASFRSGNGDGASFQF
jgi:DNA (cytosine-5)-methyltransferase 1